MTKPRTVIILTETVVTLQLYTLLIPPTNAEGYPWRYEEFWPIWWLLNAPGRPDRLLLQCFSFPGEQLVLLCSILLLLRLVLQAGVALYLSRMSGKEYHKSLGESGPRGGLMWVVRAERGVLVVFARGLGVPLVSVFASALVCNGECLSLPYILLSAISLPLTLLSILSDRMNTCDIQWKTNSDSPNKASSELTVAVTELLAVLIVAICTYERHIFLLGILITACGIAKSAHIYRNLPYRTEVMNAVESFRGVALVWEMLLLSVAVSYDTPTLTPTLSLLLVSPVLFFINRSFILYLMRKTAQTKQITSELIHYSALSAALESFSAKKTKEGFSLHEDPRLAQAKLTSMSLYSLFWTGYGYLQTGESYYLKLVLAILADFKPDFTTAMAYEVCVTRLGLKLRETPEDETLHHFLRLKKFQEQLRLLDCEACFRLKDFYSSLRHKSIRFNLLYAQVIRLHQDLTKAMEFYTKAARLYSKKPSLLEAYSSFLAVIGHKNKAEKIHSRVVRLQEAAKRDKAVGINRLLGEDSKTIVLVVPITGPQASVIIWAINASLLGYSDEDLKGQNCSILIPELFRKSHENMVKSLLFKREIPRIFQSAFKMYLVNYHKELVFGQWNAFATNLQPNSHLAVILCVRLEDSPRHFAVLSPEYRFMEKTMNFADFIRSNPNVEREIDAGNKELLWSGEYEGHKVLLSLESWKISENSHIPIVTLNKIRGRTMSSNQSSLHFIPSAAREKKTRTSNASTARIDSFASMKSNMLKASPSHIYGLAPVNSHELVNIKLNNVVKRQKRLAIAFGVSLVLVAVLSIATSSAVLAFASTAKNQLNSDISEMNTIGIRRFMGVNSAVRSKELYMINSGLTVIGNETKSRAELSTISALMKEMSESVRGNASKATGAYRQLVFESVIPWWRYEGTGFNLHHVTLINLMSEISDHAKALVMQPLANITRSNPHYLDLYRNGPAETLTAFNHTIDAYTDNMFSAQANNRVAAEIIMLVGIAIEACFASITSSTLLWLMARNRKRVWESLKLLPKPAMTIALVNLSDRLANTHEMNESQSSEYHKVLNVSTSSSGRYCMSTVQKVLMAATVVFSVYASVYVVHIYQIGVLGTQEIMLYKPLIINWAGLRRAITQFTVFNMREAWLLNSNFSYLSLIPTHQYRYSPLAHMQRGFTELEYIHHSLIYGNTQANTSRLPPTNVHKNLLFDTACSDNSCDVSLRKGIAPLVNDILMSFREAHTKLTLGETDYVKSGGKKTEKAVGALMPFLSTLVTQYDTDTLTLLNQAVSDASSLCAMYGVALFALLAFVMIPLLVTVNVMQSYRQFSQEVTVFRYLPKEAMMEVIGNF